MKPLFSSVIVIAAVACLTLAQPAKKYPRTQNNKNAKASETSVNINGKNISISYSAPSVRGRKIFGEGGIVSGDSTYPVWRAGADEATWLHTDANLDLHGLAVPAGDYSLWVDVGSTPWKLIVNKQVGQWGTEYD